MYTERPMLPPVLSTQQIITPYNTQRIMESSATPRTHKDIAQDRTLKRLRRSTMKQRQILDVQSPNEMDRPQAVQSEDDHHIERRPRTEKAVEALLEALSTHEMHAEHAIECVVQKLICEGTLGSAIAHVQCAGAAKRYIFRCARHCGAPGAVAGLLRMDGTFPQRMQLQDSTQKGTWQQLFVDNKASPCTAECAAHGVVCSLERPATGPAVLGVWHSCSAIVPALYGEPFLKTTINYLCTLRFARALSGESLHWNWSDLRPRYEPGHVIQTWCRPLEEGQMRAHMDVYDRMAAGIRGECKEIRAFMPYAS